MKYFLFILLLILPLVYAQDIDFFKTSYSAGETIQLRITTNLDLIGDLTSNKIEILNSLNQKVPVAVTILKINKGDYLAYFNTPISSSYGNYIFTINNIRYIENGILKTTTFKKSFNLEQKNYGLIQIQPGAVIFEPQDSTFQLIRISNLENTAITINPFLHPLLTPSITPIQIPGRTAKNFYIHIKANEISQSHLTFFNLGNYQIPFYLNKIPSPESTTIQPIILEPPEICIPQWSCSSWNSCSNGLQSRNCIDQNSCNIPCDGTYCQTRRSCVEPVQLPEICNPQWSCGQWTSCSNRIQTRNCIDQNSCNIPCDGTYCQTRRSCVEPVQLPEVCIPQWSCSSWNSCSNTLQTRNCIDQNSCNIPCDGAHCTTKRFCEVQLEICNPQWSCTNWNACTNGLQSRNCIDQNSCNMPCDGTYCQTERSCIDASEVCIPQWACTKWNQCSNTLQSRNCIDQISCNIPCTNENFCITQKSCDECIPEWECSDWKECNIHTKKETRSCRIKNNCNTICTKDNPNCLEEKKCEILEQTDTPQVQIKSEPSVEFLTSLENLEVTINSLTNTDLPEKQTLKGPLYIKNTANTPLTNIKFSLTGNLEEIVRINITNKAELLPNEILTQFIWINEDKNPEFTKYEGELILTSNELKKEFPIFLQFSKEEKINERETLFIEDTVEEIEQDTFTPSELIDDPEIDEPIPRPEFPYKVVIVILIIILSFILVFFYKQKGKKITKFQDFIAKLEKK